MTQHIAILGWGSLLWDRRPEFDDQHDLWTYDGPDLRIEFSRVSQSRRGALTLVIDPTNGASCRVAYTRSRRRDPEDAICDLRSREGTTRRNIGFYFKDNESRSQSNDPETLDTIKIWAIEKTIDVVVWTDLRSNFKDKCGNLFSVADAITHLHTLDAKAKSLAAEYVGRAPDFVKTPVRIALQSEPWFTQ